MPVWDQTYSVLVPEMDRDHKHLLGLLNELSEAMRMGESQAVIAKVFEGVLGYTETHFEAEEAMLEMYSYPELHYQKVQHVKFVRKIQELQVLHNQKDPTVTIDLINHLSEWFINHIRAMDREYGLYFEERGINPKLR